MSTPITCVTINLLPITTGYTGRAVYRSRFGDVQSIYRCTPGERTMILKAAMVLGLSGAEFARTVLIQASLAVLTDEDESRETQKQVKKGRLRLDPTKAPGAR